MNRILHLRLTAFGFLSAVFGLSQNQLVIPPMLTGTSFQLDVQESTKVFFGTTNTKTFGINGAFLSPTIVVNKGDVITLNVNNGLNEPTTMHWHGLHVSPTNDGGPHQSIPAGTTWSPNFEVLNNAGTFWYHPHGEGKTDLHVSKGLAGLFIIHDPLETALGLPSTYGIDDIPVIVQSKAFDVLTQIAISTEMDTVFMVNGTINPYVDLPAQVVRLRLLNGSSLRSYYFGLSNNQNFYQIASDGGLTQQANSLSRLLLAPGERSEILIDLSLLNGQQINLMSYASEMPLNIYGSATVGIAPDTIIDYTKNKFNGADFKLMEMRITNPTVNPITTIPTNLVSYTPYLEADATVHRRLVLDTVAEFVSITPNLSEGPFGIDNKLFDMDVINHEVALNTTEVWKIVNRTHIAHPFHIHDIQFNILKITNLPPPIYLEGWKDVVLVPAHDSVEFITKFTDFADNMVPYMYHCHLLHHEDDGMMGSFLVRDDLSVDAKQKDLLFQIESNPTSDQWIIRSYSELSINQIELMDATGRLIFEEKKTFGKEISIDALGLDNGVYYLKCSTVNGSTTLTLIKHSK